MKKILTHAFWLFSVTYGKIFGRTWLAGIHRIVLNMSLHGLGYDNCYGLSYTGETWFIANVLSKAKPRVCLDIGANVGNYARALARHTNSIVYAIEPARASFATLAQTAKAFSGRIIPLRTAVAHFDGTSTLFSGSPSAETATLEKGLLRAPHWKEVVPVCTIDTLIQRYSLKDIDFIKIDTEGYEREVIQGMRELLATAPPRFIQFEFNILQLYRGYTVFEMAKLLQGYDLYRLLPHGMLRIHPGKFVDNIFMFSNLVAIQKPPLNTEPAHVIP